jgi:hypothetical protein
MHRISLAIVLSLAAVMAGAQQPPEPTLEAQRAAMDKLAWMAGAWEGSAATQARDGERRSISQESIRRAAGGLAILLQGHHWRQLPDGSRGDVVLDTAGMITFDGAKGHYRFATQLQDGKAGDFDAEMTGQTLSWRIPLQGAHIRYDISRNERGQWSELGFYCRDGVECAPFFRMTLDRRGDAP